MTAIPPHSLDAEHALLGHARVQAAVLEVEQRVRDGVAGEGAALCAAREVRGKQRLGQALRLGAPDAHGGKESARLRRD